MAADAEERNLSAEAREIFTYWKTLLKHPRSMLDDRRSKTIIARLKDGYSKDDLKLAVFGCAHSRFHQGENERRQVFDSIELICRNADKVDQFMKYGEYELNKRAAAKEREQEKRQETLQASVPGDGYRTARGQLLQLIKKEKAA